MNWLTKYFFYKCRNVVHDHRFRMNQMSYSIRKSYPIFQHKRLFWQCWLRSSNTRRMRMRHEFCINIWPKDLLYSLAFFQSCKLRIIHFYQSSKTDSSFFFLSCSHSLLDQKINNVLSISNDQAILKAIQSIIQNMLATEDPSQQQLHFLQSCGFGGLWRFAGPFTKTSVSECCSPLCPIPTCWPNWNVFCLKF